MTITTKTTIFLGLPTQIHFETMSLLSVEDLNNLRLTCQHLRATITSKQMAPAYINELSQYTGKRCDWCDIAIVTIQDSYKPKQMNHRKVIQLVLRLGSNPSHGGFSSILEAIKYEGQLEPHKKGPCLCDVQ